MVSVYFFKTLQRIMFTRKITGPVHGRVIHIQTSLYFFNRESLERVFILTKKFQTTSIYGHIKRLPCTNRHTEQREVPGRQVKRNFGRNVKALHKPKIS